MYLPTLQAFLTTTEAEAFFGARGMVSRHVCQGCCRRGVPDMLARRGEHYMRSRAAEVGRLSDYPRHRRAKLYLDDTLRPACDMAAGAVKALPRMANVRRRLDTLRETYAALLYRYGGEIESFASAPTGNRIRPRRAG